MSPLISRAKLQLPSLGHMHVPRPRLIEQLRQGETKKLTLIVGGAGYGKSTLLAEWARTEKRVIWYSLDRDDDDLSVFFSHLLTSLGELFPTFGPMTEAILRNPESNDPDQLVTSLLNELEKALAGNRQTRMTLFVLDDYHLLSDVSSVHSVIESLLAGLPKGFHMVISSRTQAPLDTSRYQAAGQVNRLTNADLQFTETEIRHLFVRADISAPTTSELLGRFEGWPAGLQMLRQVLHDQKSIDVRKVRGVLEDPLEQVYGYLADQIFGRLPSLLRQFLLQTSILEELTFSRIDIIFGRSDSAEWLQYLSENNLFTIQLKEGPDVYRYHPLMKDFLRKKLRLEIMPDQILSWHRQAARQLVEQEEWGRAFSQAIEAADQILAAEVVLQAVSPTLMVGRIDMVEGWLDDLAPATFETHPDLYCCRGLVSEYRGYYEEADSQFHHAINIAKPVDDRLTLAHAWRGVGIVRQRTGDLEGSLEAWRTASKFAKEEGPLERLRVMIGTALVTSRTGNNQEALELHQQCLRLASLLDKHTLALVMNNMHLAFLNLGQLAEALVWGERSLSVRREENLSSGLAACHNNVGLVQVMQGKLAPARANLEIAVAEFERLKQPLALAYGLSNRGDLAIAEEDLTTAESYYRRSLEIKEVLRDSLGLVHSLTQMSDLRRRQGDPAAALALAERAVELSAGGAVGLNQRLPAQTAAAIARLAQGDARSAAAELTPLIEAHRRLTGNQYQLTRCLWYAALSQSNLGQNGQENLAEALGLAERWDYGFLITTLAREHPELLLKAVAANLEVRLVDQVIPALGSEFVFGLANMLENDDSKARLQAIGRLEALGVDAVWEPLDKAAGSTETPPAVREAAQSALERLHAQPPEPLHVSTLGSFLVRRGTSDITKGQSWWSRQSRTLFKYLLQKEGQPASRDTMMEHLWPEKKHKLARKSLNQEISNLRRALEPYLPARRYASRYLKRNGDMFHLALPAGSSVDNQTFVKAIARAKRAARQGQSSRAMNHYYEAVEIYQGPYLNEEKYDDWFSQRRENLTLMAILLFETVIAWRLELKIPIESNDDAFIVHRALTEHHQSRGGSAEALELANRLVELEPMHEAGFYLQMCAHAAQGNLEAARRVFLRWEKTVHRELDASPGGYMRSLYEKIRLRR